MLYLGFNDYDKTLDLNNINSTRKDAACPGGWVAFFIARGFGQGV